MNRISTSRVVIFAFLGLLIGGTLGESLGYILGKLGEMSGMGYDNLIRSGFVKGLSFDFGFNDPEGFKLDLYLVKIRFGFGMNLNLVSIIGLFVAMYIEKWSRGR